MLKSIYLKYKGINIEASRGAAARGVTVKPTEIGSIPTRGDEIFYLNLYFHFFALVSRLSAALSSAIHLAMPPEFGRFFLRNYNFKLLRKLT